MAQERLSELAVISINRELGQQQQLSYDNIIDDFASKKAERCIFNSKGNRKTENSNLL